MKTVRNNNQLFSGTHAGSDELTIEHYFHKYYGSLCFFATQLIKDSNMAEDLVAEFFSKIWQKQLNLSNTTAFRAYCYNSIRNTCINWLKQHKRNTDREKEWLNTIECNQEAVIENIIHTEVIKELHAAIQNLPPQCRNVFTKLYIEGKSVAETAKELQLAISTVKSHKQAGLKVLRGAISLKTFIHFFSLAEIVSNY